MARPRQVLPVRTYLLTRRCSERRFLLRPGDNTIDNSGSMAGEQANLTRNFERFIEAVQEGFGMFGPDERLVMCNSRVGIFRPAAMGRVDDRHGDHRTVYRAHLP